MDFVYAVIISLDVNRNSLVLSYTQLVVELFIFLYNFLERLGTTFFSEESWIVPSSDSPYKRN